MRFFTLLSSLALISNAADISVALNTSSNYSVDQHYDNSFTSSMTTNDTNLQKRGKQALWLLFALPVIIGLPSGLGAWARGMKSRKRKKEKQEAARWEPPEGYVPFHVVCDAEIRCFKSTFHESIHKILPRC